MDLFEEMSMHFLSNVFIGFISLFLVLNDFAVAPESDH